MRKEKRETETVSLTEAAARLGISVSAAYKQAAAGTFAVPVIRSGGRRLVVRAALDELLSGRSAQVPRDAA